MILLPLLSHTLSLSLSSTHPLLPSVLLVTHQPNSPFVEPKKTRLVNLPFIACFVGATTAIQRPYSGAGGLNTSLSALDKNNKKCRHFNMDFATQRSCSVSTSYLAHVRATTLCRRLFFFKLNLNCHLFLDLDQTKKQSNLNSTHFTHSFSPSFADHSLSLSHSSPFFFLS